MKERFIFDATPLIYLGKTKILELLTHLDGTYYIPEKVYTEVVVRGKELGKADAYYIQQLIDKNIFQIEKSAANYPISYPLISVADTHVIHLAKLKKAIIIADDAALRNIAEIESIAHYGSFYILLCLWKKNILSSPKVKEVIDTMISEGWYCSIEAYTKILNKLQKDKHSKKNKSSFGARKDVQEEFEQEEPDRFGEDIL